MFQVGPWELFVLAIVAVVVIGPDKLPGLAKDAANMIRTLREIATGARQQLRDELGPEFADLDLRNLNPRTAVQRAVFGDDVDFGRLNPRNALRDAIFGDEDVQAADPRRVLRETRFDDAGDRHDDTYYESSDGSSDAPEWTKAGYEAPAAVRSRGDSPVDLAKPTVDRAKPTVATAARAGDRPRPRPRPTALPTGMRTATPAARYDTDAT